MAELTPEPKTSDDFVIPEGILQARAAFLRDFERLYANRRTRGRRVVYHRGKLVAVTRDYRSAIDEVNRLDLPDGEYRIFEVSPGDFDYESRHTPDGELIED